MTWGLIAVGVGTVVSAGVGLYEGNQSRKVANSALGIAQAQFGEQQQYNSMLMDLLKNPASVTSLPNYQFFFDQGNQAVTRAGAAGGFLNSGNLGTALVQYGQGYATSALSQQEQLLASLSGLTASSSSAQNISAATGANNSANSQLNTLLSQLGMGIGRFSNVGAAAGTPTNPEMLGGNPTGYRGFIPNNGGAGYTPGDIGWGAPTPESSVPFQD